jgi:hypothetical protein
MLYILKLTAAVCCLGVVCILIGFFLKRTARTDRETKEGQEMIRFGIIWIGIVIFIAFLYALRTSLVFIHGGVLTAIGFLFCFIGVLYGGYYFFYGSSETRKRHALIGFTIMVFGGLLMLVATNF